jgi:hypothetical protein
LLNFGDEFDGSGFVSSTEVDVGWILRSDEGDGSCTKSGSACIAKSVNNIGLVEFRGIVPPVTRNTRPD